MSIREEVITIQCAGETMLGILTNTGEPASLGVVIVVGGPQYRVGSHRQFLLLSRMLAAAGYPTLRFDYRGMGDSSGGQPNFEEVGPDIAAAIDALVANSPGMRQVVLWGLCDAASASLLYYRETRDPRVAGLVLLNPWVRSAAMLARTQVKHYYLKRLFQREFWRKLLSGKLGVGRAISGFRDNLRLATARPEPRSATQAPFQDRMAEAFQQFPGKLMLILSGDDYTAKEFLECVRSSSAWSGVLSHLGLTRVDIEDADHTFSSSAWRQEVEQATLAWLRQLPPIPGAVPGVR
jgi:exosortase A-associated hydrolase 1